MGGGGGQTPGPPPPWIRYCKYRGSGLGSVFACWLTCVQLYQSIIRSCVAAAAAAAAVHLSS